MMIKLARRMSLAGARLLCSGTRLLGTLLLLGLIANLAFGSKAASARAADIGCTESEFDAALAAIPVGGIGYAHLGLKAAIDQTQLRGD